ncbi:MAG: hypothetical protein K940chlam9_00457 [Chlamydiae bacterium]|nr:hypothetical protein [Chlamydiota bacterium]
MAIPTPSLTDSPPPPPLPVSTPPLLVPQTPPSHGPREALLKGLVEKNILTPSGEITLEYTGYPLPSLNEQECSSLKESLFAPLTLTLGPHTYTASLAEMMDGLGKKSREEKNFPFRLLPPRIIGEHVAHLLFVQTGYAKRVFADLGLDHLIPYISHPETSPNSPLPIHSLIQEKEETLEPKQVPEALHQHLATQAHYSLRQKKKEYIPVSNLKEYVSSSTSLTCKTNGKIHHLSFTDTQATWILSQIPYTPNFSCDDLFLSLEQVIDGGTPFLIPYSFQKKPLESFLHLSFGWIRDSTFPKANREIESVFLKCRGFVQPSLSKIDNLRPKKSLEASIKKHYGDSARGRFAFAWNYCLSFQDQKAEKLFVSLVTHCQFIEGEEVYETLKHAMVVEEIPLSVVADLLQVVAFLQHVRRSPSHPSMQIEISDNTALLHLSDQTLQLPLDPYHALEELSNHVTQEQEKRLIELLFTLLPPQSEGNVADPERWCTFSHLSASSETSSPLLNYLKTLFLFADPNASKESKVTLAERSLLLVYPILQGSVGGKEQWESFLGEGVLPSFTLQGAPFAKEWILTLSRKGGTSTFTVLFLLKELFFPLSECGFLQELLDQLDAAGRLALLPNLENEGKLDWPLCWELFLKVAHTSPLLPCDQVLLHYLKGNLDEKYQDSNASTLFGWFTANPLPEGEEMASYFLETVHGLIMVGEFKSSEKRWAGWIHGIVTRHIEHLETLPTELWQFALIAIKRHLPKKLGETYHLVVTNLQLEKRVLLPLCNMLLEQWISEKNPQILECLHNLDAFQNIYDNETDCAIEEVVKGYALLMKGAALLASGDLNLLSSVEDIYKVVLELPVEGLALQPEFVLPYLEMLFSSSRSSHIQDAQKIAEVFIALPHPPNTWIQIGPLINTLARKMEPQPLKELDSLLEMLELVLPTDIQYEKVIRFLLRHITPLRASRAVKLWTDALDRGQPTNQSWWNLGISLLEYLVDRKEEIALTYCDLLSVTFNQRFPDFYQIVKAPPLPHFFLLTFQHFGREDNTRAAPLATNLLSCMGNLKLIFPYDKKKELLPTILDYILVVSHHNYGECIKCLAVLWKIVQCTKGKREKVRETIFLPPRVFIAHKIQVVEKLLAQAAPSHPRALKLATQANIFTKELTKDPMFKGKNEKILPLFKLHMETIKRINEAS